MNCISFWGTKGLFMHLNMGNALVCLPATYYVIELNLQGTFSVTMVYMYNVHKYIL